VEAWRSISHVALDRAIAVGALGILDHVGTGVAVATPIEAGVAEKCG
jgi:hypothetical protein